MATIPINYYTLINARIELFSIMEVEGSSIQLNFFFLFYHTNFHEQWKQA